MHLAHSNSIPYEEKSPLLHMKIKMKYSEDGQKKALCKKMTGLHQFHAKKLISIAEYCACNGTEVYNLVYRILDPSPRKSAD
jgi:hypothetical protein